MSELTLEQIDIRLDEIPGHESCIEYKALRELKSLREAEAKCVERMDSETYDRLMLHILRNTDGEVYNNVLSIDAELGRARARELRLTVENEALRQERDEALEGNDVRDDAMTILRQELERQDSIYQKLYAHGTQQAERIDVLEKERDALRAFAQGIMADWPNPVVDGFDIQDLAVKHGLLIGHEVTQPCSEEGCNCAEYGDFPMTCYRPSAILVPEKGAVNEGRF